jgi:hypothetical protein
MAFITFSTLSSNALINSFKELLKPVNGPAYLEIYKGDMLESCDIEVDKTNLLGKITCADPATSDVTNGMIKIYFSTNNHAINSGTASWARLFTGDDQSIIDLDITEPNVTNPGLLILDRTDIVKGGAIIINSMVFSI